MSDGRGFDCRCSICWARCHSFDRPSLSESIICLSCDDGIRRHGLDKWLGITAPRRQKRREREVERLSRGSGEAL